MKRELKFKIWDGINMMQPKDIYVIHHEQVSGMTIGALFESRTYLQFTGLKDKDEKEIYEGDILLWQTDKARVVGEVYFEDGTCKSVHFSPAFSTSKIIGNVYQNPELMGNKEVLEKGKE